MKPMKMLENILSAAVFSILLGLGGFSVPCRAVINQVTGDPSLDSWTYVGDSATTNYNYANATVPYDIGMYTTAFTLSAGSPVASTLSGFASVGDTVVGVGGVFNTTLSLSTAEDTRLVAKYGTSTTTWGFNAPSELSPLYGSVGNGGVGSILLGTFANTFSPPVSGNSSALVVPNDSPEEQTSLIGTSTINDDIGRVITYWNGNTLVGYESFLDLSLLSSQIGDTSVTLGNDFVLDLQEGTGNFQDSLGVLPSTAPSTGGATSVPDPATTLGLLALTMGLVVASRYGLIVRQPAV